MLSKFAEIVLLFASIATVHCDLL